MRLLTVYKGCCFLLTKSITAVIGEPQQAQPNWVDDLIEYFPSCFPAAQQKQIVQVGKQQESYKFRPAAQTSVGAGSIIHEETVPQRCKSKQTVVSRQARSGQDKCATSKQWKYSEAGPSQTKVKPNQSHYTLCFTVCCIMQTLRLFPT